MNTIEEYYTIAENEIKDHFTTGCNLETIANKSNPKEALNLLVESEALKTCTYRNDQFAFWNNVSQYKFTNLGFANVEELNTATVSYLKTRLSVTKNKLLVAKYSHILWHSLEKDKYVYGKQCIENYIDYIALCLQKTNNQDKDCGKLIDYLRSLEILTKTLNYKVEDFRLLLKTVVQKHEIFPGWFTFYVIEIAYPIRHVFDEQFNQECFICLETIFKAEDNSSIKDNVYSTALKYGAALKMPVLNWHDLMGHYYLSLATNRTQEKGDFMIPEYYAQAINYFRLSGNDDMHSKLSANFQKVKSENELPKVEFSVPIPEDHSKLILSYWQSIKQQVEILNTPKLINFIGTSETFIPHLNAPEIKVPFLDYAQGSYYDKNNNFTHTAVGGLINSKSVEIKLFIMKALKDTFKHSIETNKLTADIFINHLENDSWIGQNEESKYWITLLKPGIKNFFTLYKNHSIENPTSIEELIMTFDTLAIKIEGIIRTYAKLNSVNITKIESEKSTGGKNVETREAFMHELFTDQYPTFKALFEEKEYEFVKYLYLKTGLNIRNDIAHSFYKPENYSMEKLLLIVLSIFRISHFTINSK